MNLGRRSHRQIQLKRGFMKLLVFEFLNIWLRTIMIGDYTRLIEPLAELSAQFFSSRNPENAD